MMGFCTFYTGKTFVLAMPLIMRDLSSMTGGGTHAHCSGSVEFLTTGPPEKS